MTDIKGFRVVVSRFDEVLSKLDRIIELLEKGGGNLDYIDIAKGIVKAYDGNDPLYGWDHYDYAAYNMAQFGLGLDQGLRTNDDNEGWKFGSDGAFHLAERVALVHPKRHRDRGNLVVYTDSKMTCLPGTASLGQINEFKYDSDPTGGTVD